MTKSDTNKALSQLRDDVEAHYAYLGLFAGQGMARNMMTGIIDKLDALIEAPVVAEPVALSGQLNLEL